MNTRYFVVILLALAGPSSAWSQPALQFRWQKGQILTYKVKHVTAVTEVVSDSKQQFGSRLELTNAESRRLTLLRVRHNSRM